MRSEQEYIRLISVSSSDADVAKIAENAIGDPHIFFYGSFLPLPGVQALSKTSVFAWIPQLMEVLCYGCADELRCVSSSVQEHLMPVVYQKMRKLSVLSLCASDEANGVLRIVDVQKTIGATTLAEAEELLVEMIFDGLLCGRIDQRNGVLILQDFAAREVRPEDIPRLREALEMCCQRCNDQLNVLREMLRECE